MQTFVCVVLRKKENDLWHARMLHLRGRDERCSVLCYKGICEQAYRLELRVTLLLLEHVEKHAKRHIYRLRELKRAAAHVCLH